MADVNVEPAHDEGPDSTKGGKHTGKQLLPLARELAAEEQVPNAPLTGGVGVQSAVTG